MSEGKFELGPNPFPQPDEESAGKVPHGQEANPASENVDKILEFTSDETRVKNLIDAATQTTSDENKAELQQLAESVMGKDYEFSRWPKFFTDMQLILENARIEENQVRMFQQVVHKGWLASMEQQPKSELDGMEFLGKQRIFTDLLLYFSDSQREAFKQLMVKKLHTMPHLGIYDEKDFDSIVKRMRTFPTKSKMEVTPELMHGLVMGSLVEQMLKNKEQPTVRLREYSPDDFKDLPGPYRRLLRPETQKVTAKLFDDYTTLWTIEDPEGRTVIRTKKMEVDTDTVQQRINELPDSVPPIKVQFENDFATFFVRYVDGRHPSQEENNPDIAAVKETIDQLKQLEWYLNTDTHSGNFLIEEKEGKRKAYWVDQDILDAIVSKKTYSDEERNQASTSLHKEYPWNK